MSNVYFISDLHIGHKNILQFSRGRREGTTVDEHDEWIVNQWNSAITKNDTVIVLGDVCFDKNKLHYLNRMKGNKILLPGNHDNFSIDEYNKYFSKIIWFKKYKGFWLSHEPIHPQELRNGYNIHGHVHNFSIPDRRYINVCVEALNGVPVPLKKLQSIYLKK